MTLYLGVNSDGTEIISKHKIKRFIDYRTNEQDVLSYNDTLKKNHWMLDYDGISLPKNGDFPVDRFLTLPAGSIKRMFNIELTWEDDFKTVEL